MNQTRIFFFLFSVVFYTTVSGQDINDHSIDSLAGKIIKAIQTNEKQQAYLVTDKSVFTAGENIWFKAFLLNSISQKINTGSRFLFVDLVNEKDKVINVIILDAANKQLDSRIILPDSLVTGYYWLRAYTRQMTEGNMDGIFVKPLYIMGRTPENNFIRTKKNALTQDSIPAITFYPEGGSIITGVNSTMAIKAININKEPLSIDGYIKDNRDTICARFTTNMNGLAKFNFEPSGYRTYKAVINWNGREINYPLPKFNFFAGQLSIAKQTGGYKITVFLGDSIYSNNFATYVIGVSRDKLIFAGIGKGQYEVNIENEKLPEGNTTFYLFDNNYKLLSERSVYVHNNNLQVKVVTDKSLYKLRDRVMMNISITDSEQHPVPSLIAISVADTMISDQRDVCMLSDASREIDNIFLSSNRCLSDDDIDLLMLEKNNTYEKISKPFYQSTAADTDSLLYIKGILLNEKNEPSANKVLTLVSNSGDLIIHTDTTDNAGRFSFPLMNYTDNTQFALEARNLNGKSEKSKLIIDEPVYPSFKTPLPLKQFLPVQTKTIKTYINTYQEDALMNDSKNTLPVVKVKSIKKVDYNELKRVSSTSSILSSNELNERNSVGNAVLNVGGMHVLNGFLVINGLTSMKAPDASSEPLLLVDGVQVSLTSGFNESSPTLNYLNSLNAKDIEFIEILKGGDGANYGVRGGNGVILVNMLSTRRELKQNSTNLNIFYAKGVSNPVLFPLTDHQQKNKTTTALADKRSTLFWNGNFLSDDVHNAQLTFFTSDIPATYKVNITGITVHGDIIYKTMTFQSK